MTRCSELNSALLLSRFPELTAQITEADNTDLPHCLFECVLSPVLLGFFGEHGLSVAMTRREQKAALKKADPLIVKIFDFYEELAQSEDGEVRNLLQVSLLEPLYNSKSAYAGARLFMGAKTRELFEEVAEYLGRP